MVPQHISHSLAEKIFFIGESIQLFESDRRVEVQGAVLRDREAEFYQVQYSTVLYGTVYNRKTVHYTTTQYGTVHFGTVPLCIINKNIKILGTDSFYFK